MSSEYSEYIEIGSTPYEEECAQVGCENYYKLAVAECKVYIRQLWRVIEEEFHVDQNTAPESFDLTVKTFPHDFGSYYEVVVKFHPSDEKAMEMAYYLEANSPQKWDDTARNELSKIKESL